MKEIIREENTMEEKKHENQIPEVMDEALDQVSGGVKAHTGGVESANRPKNQKARDRQFEYNWCHELTYGSELEKNGSICRICKKPIDMNTAKAH